MSILGIMYDSDTPSAIPSTAWAVAGYIDGEPGTWTPADWARFAGAYTLTISRRADVQADFLDVESGAASPSDVPGWRGKGFYCSISMRPQVVIACAAAGVPLPKWWAAGYTGRPYCETGAVATQYADSNTSGGHYDLSTVSDLSILTPSRSSTVTTKPAIVGIATHPGGGYYIVAADGGVFAYGAPFYGSMGGKVLVAPVVGMAVMNTGLGYWLTAADGGVFAFGDALYIGRP